MTTTRKQENEKITTEGDEKMTDLSNNLKPTDVNKKEFRFEDICFDEITLPSSCSLKITVVQKRHRQMTIRRGCQKCAKTRSACYALTLCEDDAGHYSAHDRCD